VAPLTGTSVVAEGQSAHMECRVLPHNDASLKINWFKNGEALQVNPFLILLFVKLQITVGKINKSLLFFSETVASRLGTLAIDWCQF
jgi:hypothetical protein